MNNKCTNDEIKMNYKEKISSFKEQFDKIIIDYEKTNDELYDEVRSLMFEKNNTIHHINT